VPRTQKGHASSEKKASKRLVERRKSIAVAKADSKSCSTQRRILLADICGFKPRKEEGLIKGKSNVSKPGQAAPVQESTGQDGVSGRSQTLALRKDHFRRGRLDGTAEGQKRRPGGAEKSDEKTLGSAPQKKKRSEHSVD